MTMVELVGGPRDGHRFSFRELVTEEICVPAHKVEVERVGAIEVRFRRSVVAKYRWTRSRFDGTWVYEYVDEDDE